MAGVELALAVLPLAISAAEHHQHLLRTIKTATSSKHKATHQLEFYYELKDELGLLYATLQRAVQSLPSYETLSAANAKSTRNDELIRGALKADFEQVLGINAEPFDSILGRLLDALNALARDTSLALEESDFHDRKSMHRKLQALKSTVEDNDAKHSLKDRFQFTKNESKRDKAMRTIRRNNKKLERLLGSPLAVETSRADRPFRIKEPPKARTRRLSEPLFNEMAHKWPKPCDCGKEHEARLCLWNCCAVEATDRIDMLMSLGNTDDQSCSWSESSITISPSSVGPGPSTRSVKFMGGDPDLTDTTARGSPGLDIESTSLCSLLHQAHRRRSSLSMVFEQGKLWQVKSRSASLIAEQQKDLSLGRLLKEEQQVLRLRQKHILAVVLAHAALHCSDGPWLPQEWDKEHVTFFWNSAAKEVDLAKPYLTVHFAGELAQEHNTDDLFNPHSNPALLSLGVLLLEIYLSKPIEVSWPREDLAEDGQPNEYTNLTTAQRLLEKLEGDIFEGYRDAIHACLFSNYAGLDVDAARKAVYEKIVYPLEVELEHGFKIKPEDLHLA